MPNRQHPSYLRVATFQTEPGPGIASQRSLPTSGSLREWRNALDADLR